MRARSTRRLPRWVRWLSLVSAVSGVVILWIWVFAPIFVTPEEWFEKHREFSRMIREVTRAPHAGAGQGAVTLPAWPPPISDDQVKLLACAESQLARGVKYTGAYHPMRYPWGDVPEHLATSADLVIRCLRATGIDLQQMIHIDRKQWPGRYPLRLWRRRRADRSIDHRRMPNVVAFSRTFFHELPGDDVTDAKDATRFQPGDILFFQHAGKGGFPGMAGIVLDRRDRDGMPRVATIVPKEGRISGFHRVNQWPIALHVRVDINATLERFYEGHSGARLEPRPPADAD